MTPETMEHLHMQTVLNILQHTSKKVVVNRTWQKFTTKKVKEDVQNLGFEDLNHSDWKNCKTKNFEPLKLQQNDESGKLEKSNKNVIVTP